MMINKNIHGFLKNNKYLMNHLVMIKQKVIKVILVLESILWHHRSINIYQVKKIIKKK